MIAVTGVTGTLGSRVLERLAGAGDVPLRLVVRDAGRAPAVPGAEVVENPGGYADPAGFRAALDGVDTLYLVSAAEAEDRLQQHFDAVDAAVAAGVQRIVYTSFLGAKDDAVFTLVRRQRRHVAAYFNDMRRSATRLTVPRPETPRPHQLAVVRSVHRPPRGAASASTNCLTCGTPSCMWSATGTRRSLSLRSSRDPLDVASVESGRQR
jgi:hypothetical protein